MAQFDPVAFAQGLVGPVRDAIQANLAAFEADAQSVLTEVESLETDVSATLVAIISASDPARLKLLQDDLQLFLPARRDAIMAIVASKLASDAQATFDAVLAVVVKATVVAAKAFI